MRMSRYWTSGCMALVLATAGRWPMAAERDDGDLERRGWVSMTIRMPLDQAAQKLQRAARAKGLPVMAEIAPRAQNAASAERRVLVLGDQDGHTPVFQSDDAQPLDLPLRVVLQQLPDGVTQVMFADPVAIAAQAPEPEEAWRDLGALPEVISAALGPPPRTGPGRQGAAG